MDGFRFDALTRALSSAGSRRALAAGFAGALGMLPRVAPDDAAARKKPCPPCKKRKQGKCKKKLPDGTACPNGGTCQSGRCVAATPGGCPSGQKPCAGRCIPSNQCCTNSDCPALRPSCEQGACTCPPERPLLCPGSNDCQQCCTVTDCRPATGLDDGQECRNGECVCPAGKRRCPSDSSFPGRCGFCCASSECPRGQFCYFGTCMCGGVICNDVCVTADCESQCFAPCTTPGGACCSGNQLTCQQVTPTQRFCLPPE